jgi:endonuclease/exonuclease/phosphatase family metal-dependent hydrolase
MRSWIVGAGLLLASCSSVPQPAGGLKIATWNLEHLAEADGAGCRPRTESDYARLRAYAAQLDADVVGLQEVENAAAAQRVFPAAEYDIVMSGQPYPAAQGTCGQDSVQIFTPQRTGFAIRKGVTYQVNPPLEALNVSDNPARPVRWGVDVTIAGQAPLRLLNVHLKSGCAAGNKPDDEDCPVLMKQVPLLEAWIDAREREGAAFVVLGDFNRRIGANDAEVWQQWDDADPAGLDLHIAAAEAAGGPRSPQCDNGRYKDFIDYIVLSQRAFDRFDPASFTELAYGETGDAMPSDHCPVRLTIRP